MFKFRHIVTVVLILLGVSRLFAQKYLNSGFNTGVKAGVSKLTGEVPYDFSRIINEFDNKPGFTISLEVSKYFSPKFEFGVDVGTASLHGNTTTPELSAEGIQPGIPAQIDDPVEYNNYLFGTNLFCRYFFKSPLSESAFIPFIKAGGGFLNYKSNFKYSGKPDSKVLFGKGTEGYTILSTPVFLTGIGIKSNLSPNFYLVSSIDFNIVDYDFLDVVHNYDVRKNRLSVIGIYTDIKIGLFFSLKKSSEILQDKNKPLKKNKVSNSGSSYLPFAP